MIKETILTIEGLDKIKDELNELETVRRSAVIERLQVARSLGDLSENSEYDDARNEQSFVEGRIHELKEMIKHAKIVTKKGAHGSTADIGSRVTCVFEGETETYEIVSSAEADPSHGKLSIDSPLGSALIGKKKGDVALVHAPGGSLSYSISLVE